MGHSIGLFFLFWPSCPTMLLSSSSGGRFFWVIHLAFYFFFGLQFPLICFRLPLVVNIVGHLFGLFLSCLSSPTILLSSSSGGRFSSLLYHIPGILCLFAGFCCCLASLAFYVFFCRLVGIAAIANFTVAFVWVAELCTGVIGFY